MKHADMKEMQRRATDEWQAGFRYGGRGSGDHIPQRLVHRVVPAHR